MDNLVAFYVLIRVITSVIIQSGLGGAAILLLKISLFECCRLRDPHLSPSSGQLGSMRMKGYRLLESVGRAFVISLLARGSTIS